MDLIKQFKQHDIIKKGSFTLKSGIKSDLYFDFKGVMSYPNLMANISYELSKLVCTDAVLCGVPYGGIPYAVMISQIINMPMILVRNEKKEYGMCQQIEGKLFGKGVVLIEDVITTGSSILEIISILEKSDVVIKQIVCILDREAGGVTKLTKLGYDVKTLLSQSECINYAEPARELITNTVTEKLVQIINTKKTNLIASVDVCDIDKMFDIIEIIGDHICAIKIHFDILNVDIHDFSKRINEIKNRKYFLVIEDKKFADIPYISLKQLDIVQTFADIVTVHGICGESLIKELNNRAIGLLIVHMLSVQDNLIDRTYSNKVLDMGKKYRQTVGFVSQEKINGYLTFSPGVKLTNGSDGMGQCYRSINDSDADIFIVGRGIYESDTVLDDVVKYKTVCFDKWRFI